MTVIKLDYDNINNLSKEIKNYSNDLNSINNLDSIITDLTSTWTGNVAVSCINRINVLKNNINLDKERLIEYSNILNNIYKDNLSNENCFDKLIEGDNNEI